MRNISVALTVPQIAATVKWVTRRSGWATLPEGASLMTCWKCQGLRKGEVMKRIRKIRVRSVRREPLEAITEADCRAEGFPHLSPAEFVAMYCEHNKVDPGDEVTRIEFRYFETLPVLVAAGAEEFREFKASWGLQNASLYFTRASGLAATANRATPPMMKPSSPSLPMVAIGDWRSDAGVAEAVAYWERRGGDVVNLDERIAFAA